MKINKTYKELEYDSPEHKSLRSRLEVYAKISLATDSLISDVASDMHKLNMSKTDIADCIGAIFYDDMDDIDAKGSDYYDNHEKELVELLWKHISWHSPKKKKKAKVEAVEESIDI